MAAIAGLVGLSGEIVVDFNQVKNQVQRNDQTEAWRRRFPEKSRDLTVFN